MMHNYNKLFRDLTIKDTQMFQNRQMQIQCRHLLEHILNRVPDCRERSLAITKLEEVLYWAQAGISREDL